MPPRANRQDGCFFAGLERSSGDVEIRRFHINLLELPAIHLALQAFLPSIKGRLVQVLMDNTTAMWYCNKQGRVGPDVLCQEALQLWTWLERQGISLVAHHLAESLNARTD